MDPADKHIRVEAGEVSPAQHASLLGQHPITVWLTGLSGAGKSTIAKRLERRLHELGKACFILDGDNLRHGLNRDLGFSPEDRRENIRRATEVARLMNDAGITVITAFISPYREDRETARRIIGSQRFLEAYLNADLATCEARDPKGLYRLARRGEIAEFTGVSAPYEPPTDPDVVLDTAVSGVDDCVATLVRRITTHAREEALE